MQPQQYAEERGLLGKLCPGEKKLEGKTFYLDKVKKRPTTLLLEAISLLGGRIESFLHKDVSFVVTGSHENLTEQSRVVTKEGSKGTEEALRPVKEQQSVLSNEKRRPGTPRPMACGSRGKALLEKAMRNNEWLQGGSVLANARSWGVKILYADDVLFYLKHLNSEKHKRPERTYTKQQRSHVVKAAALRSPYLKIEDISRKYKPLHMQSMSFPALCYSGRYSPFEAPPPPRFEKQTEKAENKPRERSNIDSSIKDKSHTPLSLTQSPWRPRKKELSYCECCQQPFNSLEEHLKSDHHRAFVLDSSNYLAVDQLVAEMTPGFNLNPSTQSQETLNRPPTPLTVQDVCELETLTDAEAEQAVQALRRRGSASSPVPGPLSSARVTTPTEESHRISNPAVFPADMQLLGPYAKGPSPDSQTPTSTPVMPVLEVEPRAPSPAIVKPLFLDHCLPPLLDIYEVMEPHSSYSEPPVLSSQSYTIEDEISFACEMGAVESVPESLTVLICPLPVPSLAEGGSGSNREVLTGPSGVLRPSNGLECAELPPHRSCSLPLLSATPPNSKKRCRSSSPKHHRSKRRRTEMFGDRDCWLETMRFDEVMQNSAVRTHALENQTDVLGHSSTLVAHRPLLSRPSRANVSHPPLQFPTDQVSHPSLSHSTLVCIEPTLIPDLAELSPSSSDSDWDCELLSHLGPAPPVPPTEQNGELDKEILQRPCTWMRDTSYEAHLHTVLQTSPPATSLCGEEMDPSVFSRTLVQIVEVQH